MTLRPSSTLRLFPSLLPAAALAATLLAGSAQALEDLPLPKPWTPPPARTATATAPAPAAAPATVPARAATPAPNTDANGWVRLIDGSNIAYDPNHKQHPQQMLLNNGTTLLQEDWEGYLKGFIGGLPPSKRQTVLDALTRFQTEYDQVDQVIRFDPQPEEGGPYDKKSWVSIVGSMAPKKAAAALMIFNFGDSALRANRIKVVTDGAPWEFEGIEFKKESEGKNTWEYAYLPLAEEQYYNLARGIVRSRQATVRVYGDQFYADIEITDRMRKDMYPMLMAVDAINSLATQQAMVDETPADKPEAEPVAAPVMETAPAQGKTMPPAKSPAKTPAAKAAR